MEMIEACPECDSQQISPFSRQDGYRCNDCGARFETPAERERKRPDSWSAERIINRVLDDG